MSIFPKRNSPGSNLTIHIALLQPTKKSSQRKLNIRIISPSGRVFEFYNKELFLFSKAANENSQTSKEELHFYNLHSALIFSDYVQKTINNYNSDLVSVNQRFTTAKHLFLPYKIDANAELGKYQVLLEITENGVTKNSITSSSDFFFVEKVEVEKVKEHDNKYGITLVNRSTEVTPVRIFMDDDDPKEDLLVLKRYEKKYLSCLTRNTYIIYANDSIIQPIVEDTYVYRNPDVRFVTRVDEAYAWHNDDESNGYKLTGLSKEFWCSLNVLRTKGQLLTSYDKYVYLELLNKDLIREVNDLLEKV